jgi:glycerophosphoryl diester phosphodiesterase
VGLTVIAHRASPLHAPENSLAGIERAAELGADAVEIDVRVTRDGVGVLMHDRTAWRTARSPRPIRSLSSEAFGSLRHRGTDTPLPTLVDALAALPPGLRVAIDVKDRRATSVVVDAVRATGTSEAAMIWVRHPGDVAMATTVVARQQVALLRDAGDDEAGLGYVRDAVAAGAGQVSLHQRGTSERVVSAAQEAGLTCWSWVIDEDRHASVIATGVDGVVTDWPRAAREAAG